MPAKLGEGTFAADTEKLIQSLRASLGAPKPAKRAPAKRPRKPDAAKKQR